MNPGQENRGFDGNINLNWGGVAANSAITFTFPAPVTGVLGLGCQNGANFDITIQHSGGPTTLSNVGIPNGSPANLGSYTSITSFTFKNVITQNSTGFSWISIDGIALINKNIQDTVTDTPLMNYAVLSSGSNGNLINTSNREPVTYFGEVGTTYYFEVDGVGTTTAGGAFFQSQIGSTYNFGQQPFVASDVTYDQAAGTVTIGSNTYGVLREDNSANTQIVNYSGDSFVEKIPVGTSFGDAGYKLSADATTMELIGGSVSVNDRITSEEQINSVIVKSIDVDNNQITTK